VAPEISTTRFKGLVTASFGDDGDITQLIRAENMVFDDSGIIHGRRGFHWLLGQSADGEEAGARAFYAGVFVDSAMTPYHMFQIDGEAFYWTGIPSESFTEITFGSDEDDASEFVTENQGVQYGGYTYFTDGTKWQGEDLTVVDGYPGGYGPMEDHNERVWCNDNCRLYFSAVGNGEDWPAANFIDVSPVESDTITEIKSYQNRLMIFRTRDVWVLETPAGPTSWSLRKLADDGCDYQCSIEHNGVLYWFGRRGAYKFNGVTIERISDPIQDKWDDQEPFNAGGRSRPRLSYTTVFDDSWIICFGMPRNQQMILCYHTKLDQWTEWTLGWSQDDGDNPYVIRGMWAEDTNTQWTTRGLFLFVQKSPYFFISAITPEYSAGIEPYSYDTVNATAEVDDQLVLGDEAFRFNPVLQTKWSDFGEPYNKKRVTQWMLEYASNGVQIEQVDEEMRQVSTTLGNSTGSRVDQNRVRGIGYFRKVSLRITLGSPSPVGWYIRGLYGRMKARGQQIRSASESYGD
jgi:hypothetical protein